MAFIGFTKRFTMKKIVSLVLALSMVFTLYVPVTATSYYSSYTYNMTIATALGETQQDSPLISDFDPKETTINNNSNVRPTSINNIAPAKDFWMIRNNLQPGDRIHTDRELTLSYIPKKLEGADWIRMPASRLTPPSPLATFVAEEDIDVWIAYDSRAHTTVHSSGVTFIDEPNRLSAWLRDWELVGDLDIEWSTPPSTGTNGVPNTSASRFPDTFLIHSGWTLPSPIPATQAPRDGVYYFRKKAFAKGDTVNLGPYPSSSINPYMTILIPTKVVTGHTALTPVTLATDDGIVDLDDLIGSGKLPSTVTVTDGTTPATANITGWTGTFNGANTTTQTLTAIWEAPDNYGRAWKHTMDPSTNFVTPDVTIDIIVNVAQSGGGEISGYTSLADVTLDSNQGILTLSELKASGKLPTKVTVTDGNKSIETNITDWTGTFDGITTSTYTLTAVWDYPSGYLISATPISVTIDVIVSVIQAGGIYDGTPPHLYTGEFYQNSSLISNLVVNDTFINNASSTPNTNAVGKQNKTIWAIRNNIQLGDRARGDRGDVVFSDNFPSELAGLDWIRIPAARNGSLAITDPAASTNWLATFKAEEDIEVYIAYDSRAEIPWGATQRSNRTTYMDNPPDPGFKELVWLQQWELAGGDISIDRSNFSDASGNAFSTDNALRDAVAANPNNKYPSLYLAHRPGYSGLNAAYNGATNTPRDGLYYFRKKAFEAGETVELGSYARANINPYFIILKQTNIIRSHMPLNTVTLGSDEHIMTLDDLIEQNKLPTQVTVFDQAGTSETLDIKGWTGSFDGGTASTYTMTAIIDLPEVPGDQKGWAFADSMPIAVTVNVVVSAAQTSAPLITGYTPLTAVDINADDQIATIADLMAKNMLPTQVTLLSTDTTTPTVTVPITGWTGTFDSWVVGPKTLTAVWELPPGHKHDNPPVTINITVNVYIPQTAEQNSSSVPYFNPGPIPATVPTFHSISVYWRPDAGRIGNACSVEYRKAGGSEDDWRWAQDLWFDASTYPHDYIGNMVNSYRGSIVNLEPNTEYEIRLTLDTGQSAVIKETTWTEEFIIDGANNYSGGNSATTLIITQGGSAATGYVLYDGGGAVIDVNNTSNNGIVIDASYVILKNFVVIGARNAGIVINEGATHVVIENCDISVWGSQHSSGYGNSQAAIDLTRSNSQIVIQNNKIHSPRYTSNTWTQSRGTEYHPYGPCGINLEGENIRVGSTAPNLRPNGLWNIVIRYNEITGVTGDYDNTNFDLKGKYYEDGIQGAPPDSDIYRNIVTHIHDNALEVENYAGRNTRVWENYMYDCYNAISTIPTYIGPVYIFRNISDGYDSRGNLDPGSRPYKVGGGAYSGSWYESDAARGVQFWYHNINLRDDADHGFRQSDGPARYLIARNNIVLAIQKSFFSLNDPLISIDYNLFNAISDPTQPNSIVGMPTYAANSGPDSGTAAGWYQLDPGSLGYGAAVSIPNFNDMYASPDMGAHQSGTGRLEFGVGAKFIPPNPPAVKGPRPEKLPDLVTPQPKPTDETPYTSLLIRDLKVFDTTVNTNVSPASANNWIWAVRPNLETGYRSYGDFTPAPTIAYVPPALKGSDWIRTANTRPSAANQSTLADPLATFTAVRDIDVYVAYDSRMEVSEIHNDAFLSWLSDWEFVNPALAENEGMYLTNSGYTGTAPAAGDGMYYLRKKSFYAGQTVNIGPYKADDRNVYTIIIEEIVPVTNIVDVYTEVSIGNTTLRGNVFPANAAKRDIVWTVEDAGTTGAVINGDVLTITGLGTFRIKATVISGGIGGTDYVKYFDIAVNSEIPVTNITGIPELLPIGTYNFSRLEIVPGNASNQNIVWEVLTGDGVTFNGNTMTTTTATAITAAVDITLRATIVNGIKDGVDYTQDFDIKILPDPTEDISDKLPTSGTQPLISNWFVNSLTTRNPNTHGVTGLANSGNWSTAYGRDFGISTGTTHPARKYLYVDRMQSASNMYVTELINSNFLVGLDYIQTAMDMRDLGGTSSNGAPYSTQMMFTVEEDMYIYLVVEMRTDMTRVGFVDNTWEFMGTNSRIRTMQAESGNRFNPDEVNSAGGSSHYYYKKAYYAGDIVRLPSLAQGNLLGNMMFILEPVTYCVITEYEHLDDIDLDTDEHIQTLDALKTSGLLPKMVEVSDGTVPANAVITDWTGSFDGTQTGAQVLTAVWDLPFGYIHDNPPISVTVTVNVNVAQTELKVLTGYTLLPPVELDTDEHVITLGLLIASGKLPKKVEVTDGTTPVDADITGWTGAFDGTQTGIYELTAQWVVPDGYVLNNLSPFTVTIEIKVNAAQTTPDKVITGYTAFATVNLDVNEHITTLELLKASGKLPATVEVTDGTTQANAVITDWIGIFNGTITAAQTLEAVWTVPDGYTKGANPIHITITVNVTTAQTPPVYIVSTNPPSGSQDIDMTGELTVVFNKEIRLVDDKFINIFKGIGELHESITTSSSALKLAGNTAVISHEPFEYDTIYYVEIDEGAFEDFDGNAFAGIKGDTVWWFSTGTATTYTLTVEASEGGTVRIVNNGSQTGDFREGTQIDVLAVCNEGYRFKGWTATAGSIDDSAAASAVFTMPASNAIVTAEFEKIELPEVYHTLTVLSGVGGTAGIVNGGGQSGSFLEGARIYISARPNTGYSFKGWVVTAGVVEDNTSSSTVFTMPGKDAVVTAEFEMIDKPVEPAYHTLTVSSGTGGTASISGGGAAGSYKAGDLVPITASAYTNYAFTMWIVTSAEGSVGSVNNASTVFIMPDAEAKVTANFTYLGGGGNPGGGNTTSGDSNDGYEPPTTTGNAQMVPGTQPPQNPDKVIEQQLASGKPTEIDTGTSNRVAIQSSTIAALISSGQNLSVGNGVMSVVLSAQEMAAASMNVAGNIEIRLLPVTNNVLIIPSNASNSGMQIFDVEVLVDGKEVKIFSEPIMLSYDISNLNLTAEQKQKLTGIRVLPNGKVQQLGGQLIGNIFSFYTSRLSQYGVSVSENLVNINTKIGSVEFTVNGKKETSDVAPVIIDGRTMVPIRFIAEAFGASVSWNPDYQQVIINLDGMSLPMKIGYRSEGMDVAPIIMNDRTMVPLRYISEYLGANVLWDGASNSVTIYR